jgi:small multidrug resistance family-3 protein
MGLEMTRAALCFLLAGLCEIGGGYLVWLWQREGQSFWLGLAGGLLLAIYGWVATLQPVSFGRAYAAYGGIFIILSIFWGWWVDGVRPDRQDWLGAFIILIGVSVLFAPRQ